MQAKYIVFNSNSKAYVSNGEVRCYMSEASARCLDENLHSIAKINFKRRSLMQTVCEKDNTERVMSFGDENLFWDCICKYKTINSLFIVWDDDEWTIKNCVNLRNKKIRIRAISSIINSMLSDNHVDVKSMVSATDLLSLSFDILRAGDQSYVTDCLVKMFRKIVRIGKTKSDRFEELIYECNFKAISKHNYFKYSQQTDVSLSKESQELFLIERKVDDIRRMGYIAVSKEKQIYIQTDTATWWFDHDLTDKTLYYMTKRLYAGERTLPIECTIPTETHARNKMILDMIRYKESKLKYGVGNVLITEYVQSIESKRIQGY